MQHDRLRAQHRARPLAPARPHRPAHLLPGVGRSIVGGCRVWRRHRDPGDGGPGAGLGGGRAGLIATGFLEPLIDEYRFATLFGVSLGMLRACVTSLGPRPRALDVERGGGGARRRRRGERGGPSHDAGLIAGCSPPTPEWPRRLAAPVPGRPAVARVRGADCSLRADVEGEERSQLRSPWRFEQRGRDGSKTGRAHGACQLGRGSHHLPRVPVHRRGLRGRCRRRSTRLRSSCWRSHRREPRTRGPTSAPFRSRSRRSRSKRRTPRSTTEARPQVPARCQSAPVTISATGDPASNTVTINASSTDPAAAQAYANAAAARVLKVTNRDAGSLLVLSELGAAELPTTPTNPRGTVAVASVRLRAHRRGVRRPGRRGPAALRRRRTRSRSDSASRSWARCPTLVHPGANPADMFRVGGGRARARGVPATPKPSPRDVPGLPPRDRLYLVRSAGREVLRRLTHGVGPGHPGPIRGRGRRRPPPADAARDLRRRRCRPV